jgi:hypothetical protein
MDNQSSEILAALDRGEIDAAEAIRKLEEVPVEDTRSSQPRSEFLSRWRYLWAFPVLIGAGSLFGGYQLATLGGWWWLLAGPLLVIGGLAFFLGLASIESPWVHIRIQSDEAGALSTFGLSFPLPLMPLIWSIKMIGSYVPALDRTALDELLLAMEGDQQADGTLVIDVRQDDAGERVRVYFG